MGSSGNQLAFLVISLLILCGGWQLYFHSTDYEYRQIDYSGIVTDKWTHQSFWGVEYRIKVDNNKTVTLGDSEYRNYEIGDSYYWTKSKLVNKETGEIVKFTKEGND